MNNQAPRFSVIIPNFNNGATLARAIESILSQSYAAHEIIVIDDGSADDSANVARQFGDRVRYAYQANAGVSAARNHGAGIATGDWLAFLDADDCFLPQRLQVHADWIVRDAAIDFLLADQEYVDGQGALMHLSIDHSKAGRDLLSRHPGKIEIPLVHADFAGLIADGFGEIRTLSLPTKTFRQLGGFPVGKKIGEDLYFLIRLCAISQRAGVVNRSVAKYYIYESSVLRKDIVAAQFGFVETLASLEPLTNVFSADIRRGYDEKMRLARLGLAYALLRKDKKWQAFCSVLPTFIRHPGARTLKDLVSVLKGLPRSERRAG